MHFEPLPSTAAWQHQVARKGFEVSYFRPLADGWHLEGYTSALEEGQTWAVSYVLTVDTAWRTRRAQVTSVSAAGRRETVLEGDGKGGWRVDGKAAPHLDGCLDVDLEASAMTNALPIHRLALAVGARAEAPAAYVRAVEVSVERLEQQYARVADADGQSRFDYVSPAFNFACRLTYDASGLVVDYPGIAVRAG
ncbi:putative glycolipid-binding domain-containing protein [Pyxidicoccus sp. 3LFB2]